MFKLDMDALRQCAKLPKEAAVVAPINSPALAGLAAIATLAISQDSGDHANDLLTTRLMMAAMRRCDQFNDSDKARQDMREQILETPPHLRQDLLDHFNGKL